MLTTCIRACRYNIYQIRCCNKIGCFPVVAREWRYLRTLFIGRDMEEIIKMSKYGPVRPYTTFYLLVNAATTYYSFNTIIGFIGIFFIYHHALSQEE